MVITINIWFKCSCMRFYYHSRFLSCSPSCWTSPLFPTFHLQPQHTAKWTHSAYSSQHKSLPISETSPISLQIQHLLGIIRVFDIISNHSIINLIIYRNTIILIRLQIHRNRLIHSVPWSLLHWLTTERISQQIKACIGWIRRTRISERYIRLNWFEVQIQKIHLCRFLGIWYFGNR